MDIMYVTLIAIVPMKFKTNVHVILTSNRKTKSSVVNAADV